MALKFFEKILPPENKVFYDCFETAAKNCNDIAKLYQEAITNGIDDEILVKAKMLKHRGVNLERETTGLLNSTFITPIDREDIQMLAAALNKITKKIAQAMMNLNVYRFEKMTDELIQQSKVIVNASEELVESVGLLKHIHKTDAVTASHDKMKQIEVLGDEIMYRGLDKLFSGKFDAISIIKLRDM